AAPLSAPSPPSLQRDSNAIPPIVEDVVKSSNGQPLDPTTREFMESRFGRNFSHVRVHTDAVAAESMRALDAAAWTGGNDIAVRGGFYKPKTQRGRRLLAHELTHVVQQSQGASPSSSAIAETEANYSAYRVLNGSMPSVS